MSRHKTEVAAAVAQRSVKTFAVERDTVALAHLAAEILDPASACRSFACLADRAVLVAVDAPDPFGMVLAVGRDALAAQIAGIALAAQTNDPAYLDPWRQRLADAFAARVLNLAPHLINTPDGSAVQ